MSIRNLVRLVPVFAIAASLVLLPTGATFAEETGGSIDPDGAAAPSNPDNSQGDTGGSFDPNGASADGGMSIDPDG